MNRLDDQIKPVVKEIEEVSDYLYQQNLRKGYEAFNATIGKLIPLVDDISDVLKEHPDRFDIEFFLLNLNKAFEAMQQKDSVLLADILVFEISNQLNSLLSEYKTKEVRIQE